MSDRWKLSDGQIEAIRDLVEIAGTLGLPLTMMGANVRLLRLDWPLRLDAGRTTRDVDFAVRTPSWAEFNALFDSATKSSDSLFALVPLHLHRLRHRATGTLIDLVPHGGLEEPAGTIRWPATAAEMTTWGMAEAEASAGPVELADRVSVVVTALPEFVALKLFAWRDRAHRGADDLRDTDHVLRHCIRLPGFEDESWEAYGLVSGFPGLDGLDYAEHAGAAVIGRKLAGSLGQLTRNHLRPIVDSLREPEGEGVRSVVAGTYPCNTADQAAKRIASRYEILWRLLFADNH